MTKSPRTFRIDQDLSSALDRLHKRQGDHTYHVEQALRAYPPIKKLLKGESKEVSKPAPKGFQPPALGEVGYFMAAEGLNPTMAVLESTKFVDFYASKGWLVGKNKMKDWKAAARGWMSRNSDKGDTHKQTSFERLTDQSWAKGIVDGA